MNKNIITTILIASIALSACNAQSATQKENNTQTAEISEKTSKKNANENSTSNQTTPLTEKEATNIYGAVTQLKPGITKVYPVKGLKLKTMSSIIQSKDNDTIIYSEDTGHGIPTIPAGKDHQFIAIAEVTYQDLKMYLLQDGRYITANPKHVEIVKSDETAHFYPKFEMHQDDYKYLNTLDKSDPKYKAYEKYAINFGEKLYDSKKELLMYTAIHQVNGQTEGSFEIKEEPFQSFEQFKAKKTILNR
ncbi:hypothetical protein [Macrococcus capreoli]|uniref:hypothetical protein n=1 Tax=Macrococcus capreoli TaxID=2982690 RepID=UPI0021D5A303|nr:hypothetical protein [Macrococcus sp. TMW 2.2395]MCU7556325.1 hypothetical protein [Macrococcus sp. TMW 2.2395]